LWVSIDIIKHHKQKNFKQETRDNIATNDDTRRVEDSFQAAVLPEFLDSTLNYSSI
jgi:hypothetical protein